MYGLLAESVLELLMPLGSPKAWGKSFKRQFREFEEFSFSFTSAQNFTCPNPILGACHMSTVSSSQWERGW